MRRLLFLTLEAVQSPLTAAGFGSVAVRAIAHNRRSGASTTAYVPLFIRYMLHELGIREDEIARRLTLALPSTSVAGIKMLALPTVVAAKVSGHHPRLLAVPEPGEETFVTMLAARTEFFDQAITDRVNNTEQVVLMGAGYDTRAFLVPVGVAVYELDEAPTQTAKFAALRTAGVDVSHISAVTVDFASGDWFEKLTASGFRPDLPAVYIWEGVTYYLPRSAVEETLRTVAKAMVPGSVIAFDYFSQTLVSTPTGSLAVRSANAMLRLAGEPLLFGLPTTGSPADRVEAFLAPLGLHVLDYRPLGSQEHRSPFGGLVIAAT